MDDTHGGEITQSKNTQQACFSASSVTDDNQLPPDNISILLCHPRLMVFNVLTGEPLSKVVKCVRTGRTNAFSVRRIFFLGSGFKTAADSRPEPCRLIVLAILDSDRGVAEELFVRRVTDLRIYGHGDSVVLMSATIGF